MAVKELEWVSAEKLSDELYRLAERFEDEPVALEAIQAVRCWLMEERVPGIDD